MTSQQIEESAEKEHTANQYAISICVLVAAVVAAVFFCGRG